MITSRLPRRAAWLAVILVSTVLVSLACGDDDDGAPSDVATVVPTASPVSASQLIPAPTGRPLSPSEITTLAARFDQQLLTGGQIAPRLYEPINDDVSLFLQFDRSNLAEAKSLRYIGISVKGVFCAEALPDRAFTHLHSNRAVPNYSEGHGGPPGQFGYWLMWVATESFESQGRKISPGIDYQFSPTPPPNCGENVPQLAFQAPGAHKITKAELTELAALFNENPLTGGQVAPRLYKWINENVAMFIELDRPDVAEATTVRYFGVSVRGEFCKSKQPSADFTHYQRATAHTYAEGNGGPPGTKDGFWELAVATEKFDLRGRQVRSGPDRAFEPAPPPDC